MNGVLRDLGFAARMMRRRPGLTLVTLLVLGLGIGGNVAVFSVMDALLLADEPTGNLHSAQAREIMELFRTLNEEGTTIIQVTHSEANAAFGHRVVQLADGWLADARPQTESAPC